MKDDFLKPFINRLSQKQNALQSEVDKVFGQIKLPKKETTQNQVQSTQNTQTTQHNFSSGSSNTKSKLIKRLGVFVVAAIALLLSLILGMSVIGWIALGIMIYGIFKEVKAEVSNSSKEADSAKTNSLSQKPIINQVVTIDYSALNNNLYQTVEKLHKDVKEQWSNFLSIEKESLMNEIKQADLPIDKTNIMVNEALSRSLISFPLTDVLAQLNNLGQSKNISEYEAYLKSLKTKYKSVVSVAYTEQKNRLERIEQIANS